jgi:phage FluMu protein Com
MGSAFGRPELNHNGLDICSLYVLACRHDQSFRELAHANRKKDGKAGGGYPWLQIECSRCKTLRDVDLAALRHALTTCVHDLAGRLRCEKCKKAGKRPAATLLQLAPRARHVSTE